MAFWLPVLRVTVPGEAVVDEMAGPALLVERRHVGIERAVGVLGGLASSTPPRSSRSWTNQTSSRALQIWAAQRASRTASSTVRRWPSPAEHGDAELVEHWNALVSDLVLGCAVEAL